MKNGHCRMKLPLLGSKNRVLKFINVMKYLTRVASCHLLGNCNAMDPVPHFLAIWY